MYESRPKNKRQYQGAPHALVALRAFERELHVRLWIGFGHTLYDCINNIRRQLEGCDFHTSRRAAVSA